MGASNAGGVGRNRDSGAGVKCECADVPTCKMRTNIADVMGTMWRCEC